MDKQDLEIYFKTDDDELFDFDAVDFGYHDADRPQKSQNHAGGSGFCRKTAACFCDHPIGKDNDFARAFSAHEFERRRAF